MPPIEPAASAKQQAKQLLDRLPDDATWDDLVHAFVVRHSIERGLADAAEGRVVSSTQLKAALGLE